MELRALQRHRLAIVEVGPDRSINFGGGESGRERGSRLAAFCEHLLEPDLEAVATFGPG